MVHPVIRLGLPVLVIGGLGFWGYRALDRAEPNTDDSEQSPVVAPSKDKTDSKTLVGPKMPVAPKVTGPQQPTKCIGRTGPAPLGAAVFPDGTWLPPLNGVTNAPPFPGFAAGRPYSPVVRIVTGDKNIQWYMHADGSHSSTQMVRTEQDGRVFYQPGWAVGNPTKTLPIKIGGGAPK